MVSGEDPLHRQGGGPLQGLEVGRRVRGGEEGQQLPPVDQIPGEEPAPVRLVEAHVTRGVARSVEDPEGPAPQVDLIPVGQQGRGRP